MLWRRHAFLVALALAAVVACGGDSLAPSLTPADGVSGTYDVDVPTTEGCLKYCYSLDDPEARTACLQRCGKGTQG
jgi:hypothetical protein